MLTGSGAPLTFSGQEVPLTVGANDVGPDDGRVRNGFGWLSAIGVHDRPAWLAQCSLAKQPQPRDSSWLDAPGTPQNVTVLAITLASSVMLLMLAVTP